MANPFLNMLKGVLDKVQERNTKNPEVKTADPSVFEQLSKKVTASNNVPDFSNIQESIKEVQVTNEADPNVETADKSVFEDMLKEIEALKAKVAAQENAAPATPAPPAPPVFESTPAPAPTPAPSAPSEMMAMTNSNSGSLSLRAKPDMGAAINTIRIPDNSLIRVIEYSDKSIILDGQETKFVLVEYEGQSGWILDSYLNFN